MGNAEQITIYVAEGDRVASPGNRAQSKLLYQALIEAARKSGLVGMTVMRAAVGYGQRHRRISMDWMIELAPQMIGRGLIRGHTIEGDRVSSMLVVSLFSDRLHEP